MNQSLQMGKTIFYLKNGLGFHSKKLRFVLLIIFSLFRLVRQKITGRFVSGYSVIVGVPVHKKGSIGSTQTVGNGNLTIKVPVNETLVISWPVLQFLSLKGLSRMPIGMDCSRAK